MENKIKIELPEGQQEITIREGEAAPQLEPKAPIRIEMTGTLEAPAEWLSKRLNTGQFEQKDCHVVVNRDFIMIQLVINESDAYRMGKITGQLQDHPKLKEFGINQDKIWEPQELGLFMKMNKTYFPSSEENMRLVSQLMNFKARVNQTLERGMSESGSRNDTFTQVVDSNLPKSFVVEMPLFKGYKAERVEVETFAQVNGREVKFVLMSSGAQATLEAVRDQAIDEQISKIRELAPEIAIIET